MALTVRRVCEIGIDSSCRKSPCKFGNGGASLLALWILLILFCDHNVPFEYKLELNEYARTSEAELPFV